MIIVKSSEFVNNFLLTIHLLHLVVHSVHFVLLLYQLVFWAGLKPKRLQSFL